MRTSRESRPTRLLTHQRNWCDFVGVEFPVNLPTDIRRRAFTCRCYPLEQFIALRGSRCSPAQQPPSHSAIGLLPSGKIPLMVSSILRNDCKAPRPSPLSAANAASGVARLVRDPAGQADLFHVPVVCSAAAAEYVDVREAAQEIAILCAVLLGVAGVQLRRVVEFRMAAARRVCPQPTQPREPGGVLVQHALEVGRVSAVDHVVSRGSVRCGVYSFNGIGQAVPGRQPAIRFDRKGDHTRDLCRVRRAPRRAPR